jgi:NAD/NADP transhydrogenase alpha subunit
MINVTGGFLITDRMLKMFRKKEAPKTAKPEEKK